MSPSEVRTTSPHPAHDATVYIYTAGGPKGLAGAGYSLLSPLKLPLWEESRDLLPFTEPVASSLSLHGALCFRLCLLLQGVAPSVPPAFYECHLCTFLFSNLISFDFQQVDQDDTCSRHIQGDSGGLAS